MKFKYTNEKLFNQTKNNILSREDLSKKGSVDVEIKEIVDLINNHPDYCTTSSCSGRITLLERISDKKFETNWLIASHQPVTFEEIKEKLDSDKEVWLMQESFILHVFCRTIEKAEELLKYCREVGFKHSGIISVTNKIMVEVMGNEKVETIIIKDGKNFIDDNYLKVLIDSCNERMLSNREKMDIFLLKLRNKL
jgi:tRNA wybutosine-synthesizing protein 3